MFFITWIIAMIVSIIVSAGVFALLDSFKVQLSAAMIAGLAAFATSVIYLVAFFPRPRKRRR